MRVNRPIRNEAEYDAALAELERLWGAEDGTPEGDRLGLLTLLVDAYENERHAIEPPDPIDAIAERMRDLGMSRAELGALLGVGSGRVSEILNRRRALTVDMVRKLAAGLGLSERCLVQPYGLARECAWWRRALGAGGRWRSRTHQVQKKPRRWVRPRLQAGMEKHRENHAHPRRAFASATAPGAPAPTDLPAPRPPRSPPQRCRRNRRSRPRPGLARRFPPSQSAPSRTAP